ncbi:hypothetical protein PSOS111911_17745 [Pseudoalteromonas ostreae]
MDSEAGVNIAANIPINMRAKISCIPVVANAPRADEIPNPTTPTINVFLAPYLSATTAIGIIKPAIANE